MQRSTACERPADSAAPRVHASFFNEPIGQSALAAFIAGGGYVLAEKLCTASALPSAVAWSAQGAILLATLALVSYGRWVFYLPALLLFHLFAQLPSNSLAATLLDYAGSAIVGLVGAVALRTFCPTPIRFDRLRTTTVLILFGSVLAPLIASLILTTFAASSRIGPTADFWLAALPRMLCGAFASLTLVPLFIHASSWVVLGGTLSARRILEGLVLTLCFFAVGGYVLLAPFDVHQLPALLLPLLLWAALRFGVPGVCLAVLALSLISSHVVLRADPVAIQGFPQSAASLLLFLDMLSALLLLLTALLAERRETASTAQRAELAEIERHQEVVYLGRAAMVGEISGAFVHELNQPLTSILGNAQAAMQLLESKSLDARELREILADIISDDRRASEVLQRLRDLLRRDVQKQDVDLGALIIETLQLVHSELIKRGVNTKAAIDPELPPVLGDRNQIKQVLLNLIMSGAEIAPDLATGRSTRQLLNLAAHHDRQARTIEISVSSASRDIAPGTSEEILERFFANRRDLRSLGSTISRSIVEAHGGRMSAHRDGDSTIVRFTLPV